MRARIESDNRRTLTVVCQDEIHGDDGRCIEIRMRRDKGLYSFALEKLRLTGELLVMERYLVRDEKGPVDMQGQFSGLCAFVSRICAVFAARATMRFCLMAITAVLDCTAIALRVFSAI